MIAAFRYELLYVNRQEFHSARETGHEGSEQKHFNHVLRESKCSYQLTAMMKSVSQSIGDNQIII